MSAASRDEEALTEGGLLAENVMHFARLLRAAGVPVGPGRVIAALDALHLGCMTRREDFYWTLHALFVSRREHHALFDQAFEAFWRAPKMREQLLALLLAEIARSAPREEKRAAARRLAEAMFDDEDGRLKPPETSPEIEVEAQFSASLDEVLRRKDFEQMSREEQAEARAAIARMRFLRRTVTSRRFQPSHAGTRLDPRRTMRKSLRAGGHFMDFAWRRRAERLPPLVVLCDISGSMSGYSRMFLHFLHALMTDRDRVQVFLFGTRLSHITRELKRRDVDEALDRVSGAVSDWSGGTRIGAALHAFNFQWARRVLGQGANVVLITDGLDREDASLVAAEMARLKRSAKRVIWLNPLLRFEGFEARAGGIRAMLPHVDEFRPAHNLASLEDLAEALFKPASGAHDPRRWLKGEVARAA
ncbi:vWA domain-containing protein [Rhodoligotrophos defluvii]|uniref:vWA domain-containing protein n=1 Tax=Rhodoligotrophos defluvii TaxID=2561934 RepID=UPI001EF1514E|nr:VWA domain-containing protein [Rhodoligotrophos defluvii]